MDITLISLILLIPVFTLALILLWRFFLKEDAEAERAGLPDAETPPATDAEARSDQ